MNDRLERNQTAPEKPDEQAREQAEFERDMKFARKIMDRYRNALRELAKR